MLRQSKLRHVHCLHTTGLTKLHLETRCLGPGGCGHTGLTGDNLLAQVSVGHCKAAISVLTSDLILVIEVYPV